MKFVRKAGFAGVLLASSALATSAAFANGMGTPIEPAPEQPAPTVMAPMSPEPAPIMEAAPAKWSGFYIGGHLGYGFQSDDEDETLLFDKNLDGKFGETLPNAAGTVADVFNPGFCGGAAKGATPADGCKSDKDGVDAGIRAGYDMQFGSFVIGGLLEASYVNVSDSVSGFSTTPASYTFKRDLNFLGAARLRAGFVAGDDFLVYATGGAAYGDVERKFTTTNTANGFDPITDDSSSWGYQAGGGVEYAVSDSMSLGVEYLYTSLNDNDYAVRVSPGTAPATNPFLLTNVNGTDITRSDDRFDFHTVRAVANFRFGGM
jgi:outer membrane immunogenic protein